MKINRLILSVFLLLMSPYGIALAASPAISNISGYDDGYGVRGARWTGQPSNAPSNASNKYLNYYVVESQNNNYYWEISGSNFTNTQGSVWLLDGVNLKPLPGISIEISSWRDGSIRIIPKGPYTFTAAPNAWLAVSLDKNAPNSSNTRTAMKQIPLVALIQSRGYGQCTWYVANKRLAASKAIPPSAYSTTATIGATYVPQIYDVLVYGTKHVAIITSNPVKTVNGTTTTWTFTVGEMNYDWRETAGSSSKSFSVKSGIVITNIGSLAGSSYAATGYWR